VDEIKLHKAITEVERQLSRPVNYSLYAPAEFRQRRQKGDGFLGRILAGDRINILGDPNER
jgi:hypothetical protein